MMPGQYPPSTAPASPPKPLTQTTSFLIGMILFFIGIAMGFGAIASYSFYAGVMCLFGVIAMLVGIGMMGYAWSKSKPRMPYPAYGYGAPAIGQPVYGAGGSYMVPVLYKPSPYHQTVNIYPHDLQWKMSGGRQTGQVDPSAAEQFCQSCGAPMTGERCGYCGRANPRATPATSP